MHVSQKLLVQHDGPMLNALKGLAGGKLHLPRRLKDAPDRGRWALRFERPQSAASTVARNTKHRVPGTRHTALGTDWSA